MKAFKEYLKKVKKEHWDYFASPEELAEDIWRAALKWTREVIVERLKLISYDDNISCVTNIDNDIARELGVCKKIDPNDGNGFRLVCVTCGARPACQRATLALQKVEENE